MQKFLLDVKAYFGTDLTNSILEHFFPFETEYLIVEMFWLLRSSLLFRSRGHVHLIFIGKVTHIDKWEKVCPSLRIALIYETAVVGAARGVDFLQLKMMVLQRAVHFSYTPNTHSPSPTSGYRGLVIQLHNFEIIPAWQCPCWRDKLIRRHRAGHHARL